MLALENIKDTIKNQMAVALYFKGTHCSVCEVLEPKIKRMLVENFSEFSFHSFNAADNIAKLAAHYGVFNAPTLILFLNGREIIRTGKSTSIGLLSAQLERPYQLCFG